jgi:hypothetical protein
MTCTCGSEMLLKLERNTLDGYQFVWYCSKYPICERTLQYKTPEQRFDYANDDFMPIFDTLETKSNTQIEEIVAEIQTQMIDILNHFIECTWGAHYNTIYDKLIQPYLADSNTLDYFLRSEIIDESKGNIVIGKTGAKIFPDLYKRLIRVQSREVRSYLKSEFPLIENVKSSAY